MRVRSDIILQNQALVEKTILLDFLIRTIVI